MDILSTPRISTKRPRSPRSRLRRRLGRGLWPALAVAGLVFLSWSAPDLAAQTASPGSIFIDPSETCDGGTDAGGDVCITLPPGATCNTADVFLLFDDTGSFSSYAETTGGVFESVVSDLQTGFPSVNFSFGVGRFEDFGGPGNGFGAFDPLNRPFILNQALLRTDVPTFSADLAAALSGQGAGPGGGGDGPESAIEGLYQIATGAGFNGNPGSNSSVLDSGNAGDPAAHRVESELLQLPLGLRRSALALLIRPGEPRHHAASSRSQLGSSRADERADFGRLSSEVEGGSYEVKPAADGRPRRPVQGSGQTVDLSRSISALTRS